MRRVPANAPVTSVKMASAKMGKSKTTMKASATDGVSKTKSQMHRRSRSGCYTCRLRRKKCDELTPFCSACQHLGLECEYKRPVWWSNNEARRRNKEDIKIIIKRKKLAEKSATHEIHSSVSPPPPSLSHSMHTSASGSSDFYDHRNRSASIDSRASGSNYNYNNNFNSPPSGADFVAYNSQIHPDFIYGAAAAGGGFSPYEIDVKTERQMYINDVPTVRESHVSTFSTMHTPPPPGTVLAAGSFSNCWTGHHVAEERKESLSEEALNVNFFDFAHGPPQESRMLQVELDERDQRLLEHFIKFVMPTIFPILESNQHGSVGSDLILPALQTNSIYLHCCLSTAAQHLKTASLAVGQAPTEEVDPDGDIMRHRYATIWSLCEALKRDESHQQILEATLGLIFFQCVVGRPDDGLLDIAWHQHFQAAISLVQKLDLPRLVLDPSLSMAMQQQQQQQQQPLVQTPFNMTLTAWIDILGGTMLGQSPQFAHTYREKHLSDNPHLGLRELMGCEDRVMYLISEIACLEALKKGGMDDFVLCQHVSSLGEQMSLTEVPPGGDANNTNNNNNQPRPPFNANGTLSPKQLSKNMTSAFRIAARIYLCSLVPGFNPFQPSPMSLVDKLTAVLQCIPAGPQGFDRSLVWVYLMCGSISAPDSPFRTLFEQRIAALGEQAKCGSFGRMVVVMRELWLQNDQLLHASTPGSDVAPPYVHWRDILQMNGWDYLLI
ncbi:Transcriptional regulatory protein pro-1 [Beauveria bassiana D1-5]|uniref:Transcriptional regulatory protein pro-1 n=1 Tax=Beauveria bassiana D1-5 TaxID=1245745 RepID=A0A0A2WHM9_BEABA|nr:Transcriptional regulatory protein pro-1 [Beauveria bassiana D1-5]